MKKKEKNAWTHRNARFKWPGLSNRKKISAAWKLSLEVRERQAYYKPLKEEAGH